MNIVCYSSVSRNMKTIDDSYKELWVSAIVFAVKDYAKEIRIMKKGYTGYRSSWYDSAEKFLSDQATYDICDLSLDAGVVMKTLRSMKPEEILENLKIAYGGLEE